MILFPNSFSTKPLSRTDLVPSLRAARDLEIKRCATLNVPATEQDTASENLLASLGVGSEAGAHLSTRAANTPDSGKRKANVLAELPEFLAVEMPSVTPGGSCVSINVLTTNGSAVSVELTSDTLAWILAKAEADFSSCSVHLARHGTHHDQTVTSDHEGVTWNWARSGWRISRYEGSKRMNKDFPVRKSKQDPSKSIEQIRDEVESIASAERAQLHRPSKD